MLPLTVPPVMLSTSALADNSGAEIDPPVWSMVMALSALLTSIAVPPAPLMVPELTIAPMKLATAEPTTMPVLAMMTPLLVMPPVNVEDRQPVPLPPSLPATMPLPAGQNGTELLIPPAKVRIVTDNTDADHCAASQRAVSNRRIVPGTDAAAEGGNRQSTGVGSEAADDIAVARESGAGIAQYPPKVKSSRCCYCQRCPRQRMLSPTAEIVPELLIPPPKLEIVNATVRAAADRNAVAHRKSYRNC